MHIPNADKICAKDEFATLSVWYLHTYVAVTMSMEIRQCSGGYNLFFCLVFL